MAKKAAVGISFVDDKETGKYEGSHRDYMADYNAADRMGISREAYEDSARDRVADKAGQKKMDDGAKLKAAVNKEPSYTPGASHFSNTPKLSHGFAGSQKSGRLRVSGCAGAHQIGKKRK